MTAMSCTFTAIPRSVLAGGSVRFFPVVSNNTKPIISYDWDFGDGTAHGTDATPIHAYPSVSSYTTYDVTLTVTDANGATATATITAFIAVDAGANVPAIPNDGTYHQIRVFIYDDTNAMLVSRTVTSICSLMLLTPAIVNTIDKSPTTTFSIFDVGNSTATERSLLSEGKYIVCFQSDIPVFSGKVRRVTQNTQNGFDASAKVRLWDFECDSDLMKLSTLNVKASVLSTDGKPLNDTSGNIVRLVLTPETGEKDTRGNICCNDTKITYNLNASTSAEQTSSRYDHLTTLRGNTNYDLITRPDTISIPYTLLWDDTWTAGTGLTNLGGVFQFVYDPTAPATALLGGYDLVGIYTRASIYRTTDGAAWTEDFVSSDDNTQTIDVNAAAGYPYMALINNYTAGEGYIYVYNSGTSTWDLKQTVSGVYFTCFLGGTVVIGSNILTGDTVFYQTPNSGATWSLLSTTGIDPGDPVIRGVESREECIDQWERPKNLLFC